MLPYARIASVLEDISRAERRHKASLVAGLLTDLPAEMQCPCVRLLTGELWPSWEQREMGMGPEAIAKALAEISIEDVQSLRERLGEMGAVAEAALKHKTQHPISSEPLEAMQVYRSLIRISLQKGLDSEHRKGAILRGLFLEAEPIEAKYMARTVMKGTLVGLGPQTIIDAISRAIGAEKPALRKAYAILPELGLLIAAASRRALGQISMMPSRPSLPMLIRKSALSDSTVLRAYIPIYPGLRVQVHKTGKEFFVYTMRLKNITPALMSLSQDLLAIGPQLIAEAMLVCFQDGKILEQADVVRFINRRHLSRKSSILPALIVMDLLWLNGIDLTKLEYAKRRHKLKAVLGAPKSLPFTGISLAEERLLEDTADVQGFYNLSSHNGVKGLFSRDLAAPYLSGSSSQSDRIIKWAGDIAKHDSKRV
jgi:DNA ligase-1